jgi:hypothetical protein
MPGAAANSSSMAAWASKVEFGRSSRREAIASKKRPALEVTGELIPSASMGSSMRSSVGEKWRSPGEPVWRKRSEPKIS